MMQNDKKKLKAGSAKDAGLALVLLLLLVYHAYKKEFILALAVVFLLLSMTVPSIFTVWARIWFGLANGLGKYISKLILAITFGLIVVPVGVLRRLLGKDSLQLRRWKDNSGSVLEERNRTFTKEDIDRPF